MKMNKRGDKILSVYWFVVLAIIAGGIFGMVYVFYGTPYDVRNIEADIMTNKIADCISYAGRINENIISGGKINSLFLQKSEADFLKDCHLNFDSVEWAEEQYYTEINFYRLNNPNNSVLNIKAGNNKWLAGCEIQENKSMENLPQCVRKGFYSVDDTDNQYIIKILTIVRKSEKNVKI